MVFGGAATDVYFLTTALAYALHCELVIARETSRAGEKRCG